MASNYMETYRTIAENYGVANTSGLNDMECLRGICATLYGEDVSTFGKIELLRIWADRT